MIMKGSKELEMEKWIEKGNVLIEALSYIRDLTERLLLLNTAEVLCLMKILCRV